MPQHRADHSATRSRSTDALALREVDRVDDLAVDVELQLAIRGVADAHRREPS
jgi:hypothetical protein